MRILHVSAAYWPFWGGAEYHLKQISERLVQDGHEVTVLCGDALVAEHHWIPGKQRAQPPEESHNGVRIQRCRVEHLWNSTQSFPNLRRLGMLLSMLPGTLPLLRRIGRYLPWLPTFEERLAALGPFDLVHGFNISLEAPLIAAWRYARREGLPFFCTPFVHTGVPGDRMVERHYTMQHQLETLRDSDLLFTMTEIEARRLAELGVPGERLVPLGVGVPLQERMAEQAIDRFRQAHALAHPYVAFLGSITRDKGAIHLVEAARLLWEEGRTFEVVLGGTPVTEFERYYRILPAAARARVRLLGALDEAEKWCLLGGAEILAMPSRVDSFGIVYLESWTQGRPVIGAHAGGVPAVISDGVDGLLVPYGDVAALARAVASLLDDPARGRAMGLQGREKVRTRYSPERIYGTVRDACLQHAGAESSPGAARPPLGRVKKVLD